MENCSFDAELVWQKMLEDAEFTDAIPDGPARQVYRDMIDELPDVFGEWMSRPYADCFVSSRICILCHLIAASFINRLICAIPHDDVRFRFIERTETIDIMTSMLTLELEKLKSILKDISRLDAPEGISGDEYTTLVHRVRDGISEEAAAAYRDGTLTVENLLMVQPFAILRFKNY